MKHHDEYQDTYPTAPTPLDKPYDWKKRRADPRPKWTHRLVISAAVLIVMTGLLAFCSKG